MILAARIGQCEPADIFNLGQKLHDHIRLEERQLFPAIQESDSIESIGPELSAPTRWIVTRTPGTGASPVRAGRTTRPSTLDGGVGAPRGRVLSCAHSGSAAASTRQAMRRASLRIKLPEVFGAQVLKVRLELIGGR